MKEVYVKSRGAWRQWLSKNHTKSTGIWLVFFKKDSGSPTLEYDESVEEALCFGWIDSIIKKRDGDSYLRKFTPRKPDSRWSEINKKRVQKMTRQGLMKEPGLTRVKEAKQLGTWQNTARPEISLEMPEELKKALAKNNKAKAFFDQLAPSYKKHFIGWVAVAKRQETRDRRVAESIALLAQGKKLGLK